MNKGERIIVALDLDTAEQAVQMARMIAPVFPFFKIGSRLFTQAGPALVKEVLRSGRVFLDLKFHDIPSVVADAAFQAANLGVSLMTVHASGGAEMMQHCARKLSSVPNRPRLLAVTVLTSLSDLGELGIARAVPDHVKLLADLARRSEMDGIVCSPAELPQLRPQFPAPFLMVTPGIRSASDEKGDQKRTASAAAALESGADYLVIGRPIVAASNPVAAAERIAQEISE